MLRPVAGTRVNKKLKIIRRPRTEPAKAATPEQASVPTVRPKKPYPLANRPRRKNFNRRLPPPKPPGRFQQWLARNIYLLLAVALPSLATGFGFGVRVQQGMPREAYEIMNSLRPVEGLEIGRFRALDPNNPNNSLKTKTEAGIRAEFEPQMQRQTAQGFVRLLQACGEDDPKAIAAMRRQAATLQVPQAHVDETLRLIRDIRALGTPVKPGNTTQALQLVAQWVRSENSPWDPATQETLIRRCEAFVQRAEVEHADYFRYDGLTDKRLPPTLLPYLVGLELVGFCFMILLHEGLGVRQSGAYQQLMKQRQAQKPEGGS